VPQAATNPEDRYRELVERYLPFYDALRRRERRPKSAAQRQFQDVAWGKAEPVTEHEKAYVWHLTQLRISPFGPPSPAPAVDHSHDQFAPGARPVSVEVGSKWDKAYREKRGGREFY
jgi:hypothetical protein